ncbi:hypothetical protein KO465_04365 [Candidatus Micrarchaeota archaeon]|jgi:hypothetical protein|nr:hypothetical protein [Candidatus Micrarchaeota archaeon]
MDYTHSPPFRVLHEDAIPAGGFVLIRAGGLDHRDAAAKYAPFNRLFIQNFDSQPLEVEYGIGRKIRVPGGASVGIDQPGIDQIRIENVGGSATSEPIEVIYQLQPTVENLLYAMQAGIPLHEAMRR